MPDQEFPDPMNPNHIRLPGSSVFLEVGTNGQMTARNVPPPPPTPQPQATNIPAQPKPPEAGGHSL